MRVGAQLTGDFSEPHFATSESKRYVVGAAFTAGEWLGFSLEFSVLYRRTAFRVTALLCFVKERVTECAVLH